MGQSVVVLLRGVTKIHVNMFRAPYNGTCLFDAFRAGGGGGGLAGDARVATLRWLNSLKQTRRGLCTSAPYHRIFYDNGRPVHRP